MVSVDLKREDWLTSIALAKCRVKVGNSFRAKHQDRGRIGNILVDVQGCMGELVGLTYIESLGYNCVHEILATKPVKSYDISYPVNGKILNVDVKCLFLSTIDGKPKRYFLIDKTAHDQHRKKNVDAYLPVLTDMGGNKAFIGDLIMAEEVNGWELKSFNYGSTAYNLNLTELTKNYFQASLQEISSTLKPSNGLIKISEMIDLPAMEIPVDLVNKSNASIKEITNSISWLVKAYQEI